MSKKDSYTTAEYLEWKRAVDLIHELYRDEDYRMSLLFGCGCFFGMRIGDLLKLTWDQILHKDSFVVNEHKTGKRRVIYVNAKFRKHIALCHKAMNVTDNSQFCFLNKDGNVISIQMINRLFKKVKIRYGLEVENFSTHSMRKTWSRCIYDVENSKGRGERALVVLSELMNHSSPSITRRYIGLRQQELSKVWDDLKF